ncbi:hypothetical protein GCM10009642_15160 [Nocardiopsis metallicus]
MPVRLVPRYRFRTARTRRCGGTGVRGPHRSIIARSGTAALPGAAAFFTFPNTERNNCGKACPGGLEGGAVGLRVNICEPFPLPGARSAPPAETARPGADG